MGDIYSSSLPNNNNNYIYPNASTSPACMNPPSVAASPPPICITAADGYFYRWVEEELWDGTHMGFI